MNLDRVSGRTGIGPGANLGENCAIFEAVHGSAPDIAGRGLANATAMLLSARLMLHDQRQNVTADRVENAIQHLYREGRHLTRDAAGPATTDEFTNAVIGALES